LQKFRTPKKTPGGINQPAKYYREAALCAAVNYYWIPACAGMTKGGLGAKPNPRDKTHGLKDCREIPPPKLTFLLSTP